MTSHPLTITVDDARRVSGLLLAPREARACYVIAHGAGAGMSHPFMAAIADGLAERDVATLLDAARLREALRQAAEE
jgi:predicted alpha/beta-hydrolase family hydrolase